MLGPSVEAFYDRSYPITRRGRCCDYDVIELLASRTVPREGRGPLPGGVRDSSEYSWLVNALHGEFSAANRWGEMHRSIFTWVCYCISQSGVRAVALLEKPRDRVRLMLGEVRRRFTAKRSHRPVWDEFDDDLQTSDRMAREVAEREAAAGRRGRGKGKVDETTSAAKPARTRGTSRRPAPAKPANAEAEGEGEAEEGPGTPSPDPMESDESAGVDNDTRERMRHALFVRAGIDAHLFELIGCPSPSSRWPTQVEHMWLANSGLQPAQNPVTLHIAPDPELASWLEAEAAQPPWRRFAWFHENPDRPQWERLEIVMPNRHPANIRMLKRAVASFELAASSAGLLVPLPDLPADTTQWNALHWDAFFIDRFELHVSHLPPYYVEGRWRSSANTGPTLSEVVAPVPSHARWMLSCLDSGRTGPGITPFVPREQQKLPDDVSYFYDMVNASHPGCEELVRTLAPAYPANLEIPEVVQREAAKDDSDSWLATSYRCYDTVVEGANWLLGEIHEARIGGNAPIRSLPFVQWLDNWEGEARRSEADRDAEGDVPMASSSAAPVAGPSGVSTATATPAAPAAGARTWYDGTPERVRYCDKYCVLLPDPLGGSPARNPTAEQYPWAAIPRLVPLTLGENGPPDAPCVNATAPVVTRFHPNALDADAAMHCLASTLIANVEGHNRGIPAAVMLYGPPVPPAPTSMQGTDVQGLPYVAAMMGLDESIMQWVALEPTPANRLDGPITRAYSVLNTALHHTCRQAFAYLARPHTFEAPIGVNRAKRGQRLVVFHEPRFGRGFGIRGVAQPDARVRGLLPGTPIQTGEKHVSTELDVNNVDVMGDPVGTNATRCSLGPAHVAMQHAPPSEARRQYDRLPRRVFVLGFERPRPLVDPKDRGHRKYPVVCPGVQKHGPTWSPLPPREFVASLLAGYVNSMAAWVLGHELPDQPRPAPTKGFNPQMHIVGPTAIYEFMWSTCYRADPATRSAAEAAAGAHARSADGDELYAVLQHLKSGQLGESIDETAALVIASQLPLTTAFWLSMPDLPRPNATHTSWLDNAADASKRLSDALLQIWGLPATKQLRAVLAKYEQEDEPLLSVRRLERILPARVAAHGMRPYCHVERDTWAARHLVAGATLAGQEPIASALLNWVQKINDVLWPIFTGVKAKRIMVSDLYPAPALDTVAQQGAAPFPAPPEASDLGDTVAAITPFHYRLRAELLQNWNGYTAEDLPPSLRAQQQADHAVAAAAPAKPAASSSASGTTGSGSREPSPAPKRSATPSPSRKKSEPKRERSRDRRGRRQSREAAASRERTESPRQESSSSPAPTRTQPPGATGQRRERPRILQGSRVTVRGTVPSASSTGPESLDLADMDDAEFTAYARQHGLEFEPDPAEDTRQRLLAEAERRSKRARVAAQSTAELAPAPFPYPYPASMGPPPPRVPGWGLPPPPLLPQIAGPHGYYWPHGLMYPPAGPAASSSSGQAPPATDENVGSAHYQAAKNWRARLRLLLERNAQPAVLSEMLDEIATAAGHDLTGTTLPSGASWAARNAAATVWAANYPGMEQFDRIEAELLRLIGLAQEAKAEGRCRPAHRAILRIYGDGDDEDDFATRAALQPRAIAERALASAAASSEPTPVVDGADRKSSAAPTSRSEGLHARSSKQRAALHFQAPEPDELVGYGPDRPTDLAVPESPDGAPDGRLNAPVPIAKVIDGINGLPHDFRRLLLQCPGFVYALHADGTLGESTRVKFIFDTGAMGDVGEKKHMPPGTRYTGVKVLRAFLHHATITAEIAHVVLRFGDVYVSRAVYVVPDGSLGPNADMLLGIGTIMRIEGRIDTTSSGWCLHARDAHFRPHVIPFLCPDNQRGLSLSGCSAPSS
eukprot:tig00000147_g9440.t1